MKERLKKKKIILIVSSIAVLTISLIGLFMMNKLNKKEQSQIGDKELAKAMESSVKEMEGKLETPILTPDSGIIVSAKIIERKTGTGPFDAEEGDGNDTSADDNIIRSFDQVTWTVEANIGINNTSHGSEDAKKYNAFKGGRILIEVSLPENCKGLMHWDMDAMSWADETKSVGEDGLTFRTGYKLPEDMITVPGKQTMALVLRVDGATSGMEINPVIKMYMEGNEIDESKEDYEAIKIGDTEGEPVKVTSKGGYNIYLRSGSRYQKRVKVNLDGKDVEGRMYGYGIIMQLYSMNTEKRLRGIEYPKGDITFDIDLKLEAIETIDGKNVITDITDLVNPILWNYRIHENGDIPSVRKNPDYGNISDRNMYFGNYTAYDDGVMPYGKPYGKLLEKRKNSIYNSGNISMNQQGSKINVTIKDYDFDGIFPTNNQYYTEANGITYGKNIGCFNSSFFQIFIPDCEETEKADRDYYITVSDSNMEATTISGEKVTNQIKNDDDSIKNTYYKYKKGTYGQNVRLFEERNGWINNDANINERGEGRKGKGQIFRTQFVINDSVDNDIETRVKSVNKLMKFDGEGIEPILQTDGSKVSTDTGTMTWKCWYITKKDGSNWINQEERNQANIENLIRYENLEDIPKEDICVGMYFESQGGELKNNTYENIIDIRFKVKETAPIGETYGIVQDSDYWSEILDRNIQTIENPDATYPTTVFSMHNQNYIKTEYDENGNHIKGTHNGGTVYGNSILVIGADSSISTTVNDINNGEPKKNYDLSRNENEVNFRVSPVLAECDSNLPSGITDVTVKVRDILPKGLAYIPGSSNYGEPSQIINNEDGTTTLVWEIYNCAVGKEIDPITFKAKIAGDTPNGTTYINTAIIEPEREKVGIISPDKRTATYSFQVTNLDSHRLYKEVETPIIENNGMIKYKLTYSNKTKAPMPDFQLLDIMPYNGDGRGSTYNGTYTLDHIEIKQTSDGVLVPNDNLSLFTTTKLEAREISPKDESIGVSEIWNKRDIGANLDEPVTVFAIKGEIQKNTEVEVGIYVKTQDNKPQDIYANSATAQTSKDTEVITTAAVKSQVASRKIIGNIWYDTNEDGLKDEEEEYAKNIEVMLKKSDGTEAVDINGNKVANILTDADGKYTFINLPRDRYIVEIVTASKYKLTKPNVGSNLSINSKFTEKITGEKQSEIITKLDSIDSPEIIQEHINAGLVVKDSKVIVKYLDLDGNVIVADEEIVGKVEENYKTEKKDIQNYVYIKDTGNTEGKFSENVTEVIYYYSYNKQDITINKIWDDNNNELGKRPNSVTLILKGESENRQELTKSNEDVANPNKWSYTFKDMPVYKADGTKIDYTVNEANTGSEFYIKSNVDQVNKTVTNKFIQSTDRVQIAVNKKWDDNNNKAGKRPNNITLQVKNGETIVAEEVVTGDAITDEGWSNIFELPKYDENNNEINYVIGEKETGSIYYTSANTMIDQVTRTITNKFAVPNEKISIDVTKVWDDNHNKANKRPASVELKLMGNGIEYKIRLTSANASIEENKWSGRIADLPKYDENGDLIEYVLSEENLENIFYKSENSTIDQVTKTITNKFEVPDEKISIDVTKIWDDNSNLAGKRPDSVTVYITGNGQEYAQTLTNANVNKVDSNKWEYKFDNIPKYNVLGDEIKYILDEKAVDSIYYMKSGVDQATREITNTFAVPTESMQIQITKIWEDRNNEKGIRPDSITLQIKQGEKVVKEEIVIGNKTTDEGWSHRFEVPKYDEDGNEIEYIINEKDIGNEYYVAEVSQENKTIINRMTKVPASIKVRYVDKNNNEEIADELVKTGIVGEEYNIESDKKDITGYTLVEEPTEKTGIYTEEVQEKIYYYAKNSNVIVKYLEETTNKVLEAQEEIAGYEGKAYITNAKVIPNYEVVSTTKNTEGIMGRNTIEVIYYYSPKKDAEVEVKYVDKALGTEIEIPVIHNGHVGDVFDISADKKDIPNYTLIEEPVNKTGTMTEEKQTFIYYYAVNTKVIVKYLEKGSNAVLAKQEEILGYEGKDYTTLNKKVVNYTFVEDTKNTTGKMTRDEIEVIYYYIQNSGLTVNHIDKNTGVILDTDNITGLEGNKVTTSEKEIPGYTLVEKPVTEEYVLTKENQIVEYYYAKNTKVIVKYLEEGTDKVLANEVVISGLAGDNYTTKQAVIDNYIFTKTVGNVTGTMTNEEITVIYYYTQNTKVTVNYIDKISGKLLDTLVVPGKVGDKYTSTAKDFKDYVLVEKPASETVTMTKEEIILNYYYAHVSAGVIEKHIDVITGEEIENKVYEGNEGDSYKTTSKEFVGYDLVKEKLPVNAEGTMSIGVIEVKYYYIKKAKLVVNYIDKLTGKELTKSIETNGHENDDYTTKTKDFEGYKLEKIPEDANGKLVVSKNADGTFNNLTEVNYYYVHEAKVVEKHVDEASGKILKTEEHSGYEGDLYEIKERVFDGYNLVTEKLPTNAAGTMTRETIEVIYYYKKKAKLIIEYIDAITGERIKMEIENGSVGDKYNTKPIEIDGYDVIKEKLPANPDGIMTEEDTVVRYYYKKKAKVIADYLEIGTEKVLEPRIVVNGYIGDNYRTELKNIKWYKLVNIQGKTEGTMEVGETKVTYYYQKLDFNISVDKMITRITVNGKNQKVKNGKLEKVEIYRKDIENTAVEIEYTIVVKNTGELAGKVVVEENIPKGLEVVSAENWVNQGGILRSTLDIKEGEVKYLTITLKWTGGEENFGTRTNNVKITDASNEAKYSETNIEDNTAKAELIITISTGDKEKTAQLIVGTLSMIANIGVLVMLVSRKNEH